jgi:hypothetical protein
MLSEGLFCITLLQRESTGVGRKATVRVLINKYFGLHFVRRFYISMLKSNFCVLNNVQLCTIKSHHRSIVSTIAVSDKIFGPQL